MSGIGNPIIENALQGSLVELSRRNERIHLQIRTLNEMVVSLRDDNAKLRELVRDMYECVSHANEQDWFYFECGKLGCGMSCTVNGEECGLMALAERMRELGVEVE